MGTSALQVGKSGLLANQKHLDIIGANISNVSTVGYHNSRAEFSSLMSRTLDGGSGTQGNRGGINPMQIGLGVKMSAVSKNFIQGRLSQTGQKTDFGIDGKGFMPVATLNSDGSVPDNKDWYLTRDGSMSVGMITDNNNSFKQVLMQKGTGMPLLGVPSDPTTGLVPSGDADGIYKPNILEPIEIPSDSIYPAEATKNIFLTGNLNASGDVATQPAKQKTDFYLFDGSAIKLTTDLADLYNDSGTTMFTDLANEPTISVNMDIGGKPQSMDFIYGQDGTTVDDLGKFYTNFIDTSIVPPAGIEEASVQFIDNQLVLTGNLGQSNNLSNLSLKQNDQRSTNFTEIQKADGESTRFTSTAYDSLGNLHDIDLTLVKEDVAVNNGQTWRWFATSKDNAGDKLAVGTGTVLFDNQGSYVKSSDDIINLNLDNGAVTPFKFDFHFDQLSNLSNPNGSDVTVQDLDGFGKGELRDWIVESNGTVVGNYTNGKNREFGRIPILTLTNQAGLMAQGDNLYKQSENTGDLFVRTAGTSVAGNLRQFTLEDSNVDLAVEMTRMIEAQRAFSSNSKVITTDQEIIDVAINLIR